MSTRAARRGRAFVYHGRRRARDAPAWTAESDRSGPEFGRLGGAAGDVNGDGYSDVIVGALAYDNGRSNEGRAFVYRARQRDSQTTHSWNGDDEQFRCPRSAAWCRRPAT